MTSIFLDCNDQLAPIFRGVSQPGDPTIFANMTPFGRDDLPRVLDGYAVCLDDHTHLPTELIAQCPALKHIVFLGTGAASYMDVAALEELGIRVHTIKGYGDRAVAEHTIALMFACARDVARMDRHIRAGTWQTVEGAQLAGKTLGVIGLGGIGAEVAALAQGIGMTVIAWNRTILSRSAVTMVSLDELLARADVISLHVALNDDTRGMINASHLARAKPGAMLVNTARGALIDEAALIAALANGTIRHAGLDVFHDEPLLADHPLTKMENVTLTAHAGFCTPEATMTLLRRAIDIVKRIVG